MKDETKPDFSNRAYLLPHINREGVKFGVIALVIAAAASVVIDRFLPGLGFLEGILFLLAYGTFLFFRDPERYPPDDEKAVLSPADGRVCMITKAPFPDSLGEMEEYKGREFWRVSILV